jgi:Protein of unknown function (DUF1190)
MRSVRNPLAVVAFIAVALSGCGKAEEPKVAAPPAEHGVFISSTDCADSGKITEDACGHAIDQAVANHNNIAPVYKTIRQCEAAEGPERCDKTGDNEYRIRIQAFFVTMSEPPTAVPLYPPVSSTAAFRSPSKQELSVKDDSLNMSHHAMSVASENARLPAPVADGGAALGKAAADIH